MPTIVNESGSFTIHETGALTRYTLANPSATSQGALSLGHPEAAQCDRLNIPEGVFCIPSTLFHHLTVTEELTLPSTLRDISCRWLMKPGSGTFCECVIPRLTLPIGLQSMGELAFSFSEIDLLILPLGFGRDFKCSYQRQFLGASIREIRVPERHREVLTTYAQRHSKVPYTVEQSAAAPGMACIRATEEPFAGEQFIFFLLCALADAERGLPPVPPVETLTTVTNDTGTFRIGEDGTLHSFKFALYNGEPWHKLDVPPEVTCLPNGIFAGESFDFGLTLPGTLISIDRRAFSGAYINDLTLDERLSGAAKKQLALALRTTFSWDDLSKGLAPEYADIYHAKSDRYQEWTYLITPHGSASIEPDGTLMRFYPGDSIHPLKDGETYRYLEIPEGVTNIPAGFFRDQTVLWAFRLPKSLQYIACGTGVIGSGAFTGCAFPTLTIPPDLVRLGSYAFGGCTIHTLVIPDGFGKHFLHMNARQFKGALIREIRVPLRHREVLESHAGHGCCPCISGTVTAEDGTEMFFIRANAPKHQSRDSFRGESFIINLLGAIADAEQRRPE